MKFDIVRAWKDETYRQSLSEEECSMLPANPAGEMELSDSCLHTVYGGIDPFGGDEPTRRHRHGGDDMPLIGLISNIRLFSVNVLASPFAQTCFQNQ